MSTPTSNNFDTIFIHTQMWAPASREDSCWIAGRRTLLTVATPMSPAWQASSQTTHLGLKQPPIVSATDVPAGTETFAVKWIESRVRIGA